ncbi:MAG: preprotein translocase subunit SecE, partial [Clostridiales bacterium]|nr:preprotein translocase subunit SecE [Clostridiales bacterium]
MADSAKENKISFFDGVKAEWSKIIWPNQDQLTKQ